MRAADADFRARVKANDKTAAAFIKTVQSQRHPITLQQTTEYEGKLSQHGPALLGREQEHLLHLIWVWSQPVDGLCHTPLSGNAVQHTKHV